MDFQHDPDMVLPPGEVWDQRGMFVYLCFCDFDSVAYVYMYMDVDSIFFFVFADVGPRPEVEMVGESACQGLVRPSRERATGGRATSEG
jgi:hypothetical protein